MSSRLVNPVTGQKYEDVTSRVSGDQIGINENVFAATNVAALTFLAPPPSLNATFAVNDADGNADTNPITIDGNGTLIDGAETFVISVANALQQFIYDRGQWRAIEQVRVLEGDPPGRPITMRSDLATGSIGPAGPPGPASPPYIIFRPGVASAGDHVATWAEVETFVDAQWDGPITVYLDSSEEAVVIPSTSNMNARWSVTLRAFLPSIDPMTVEVQDGAYIENLAGLSGVILSCEPSSEENAPLQFADPGRFVIDNHGGFNMGAESSGPAVVVFANLIVAALAWVAIKAGAEPIFFVDGETSMLLRLLNEFDDATISDTLVSGDAAATLVIEHDASTIVPPQVGFDGTSSVRRIDLAESLDPSRGASAARPANAIDGQMYFDTDLGVPVWWVDAIAQWVISADSVVPAIIWRPGASGPGMVASVVATWAGVESFIAAQSGAACRVYVDDSLDSPVVPLAADTDCAGAELVAFSAPNTAAIFVEDGGRLRNLSTLDGVVLFAAPTAVSPLSYSAFAVLVCKNGGGLFTQTGALVALVAPTTADEMIVIIDGAIMTNNEVPLVPIISLPVGGQGRLVLYRYGNTNTPGAIRSTFVSGDVTSDLVIEHDASVRVPAQTLFLGSYTEERTDWAAAAEPSVGATGARPAAPQPGEMFFDTTEGFPIWWDGAAWVDATGAAV